MSDRYLSRKFIVTVLTLASATALVAFGLIADSLYATIVIATVSGYQVANVGQKAVEK